MTNNTQTLEKIGDDYFDNLGIRQLYVSNALKHFSDRFMKKYKLTTYTDDSKSTLFFGIYDHNDMQSLIKHKGKKYVMFGGTDVTNLKKNISRKNLLNNQKVSKYFTISNNVDQRVRELGFISTQIDLSFHDNKLFAPISKYGNKIYIYNGYSPGNEQLYGKEQYEEVVKRLPQYEYIYSNQLKLKHEQMPALYAQCFMGLRLTPNDGNASTVQEMTAMGIPVVHNGEQGGLVWKNVDDVVNYIKKYAVTIGKKL